MSSLVQAMQYEKNCTTALHHNTLFSPHENSSSIIINSTDCVNNLPNELLAKIFSTVTVASRWQDPWTLPSPALLSSVCSLWRIVAQNTPELWVNIMVPLHKSTEDCRRWIAEWIARSGILEISVMVDDKMGRGAVPHLINMIMGLLQQHSERLRRLALHGMHSTMVESALFPLRSAPNLQQLTIYSGHYSSSWFQVENNSQRQYSLDFPRLTILKAQGLMVPPISNLTSLTVGRLCASYLPISQYFAASPGLKHLTLHNLMPLADPPSHAALIRADSLRSLAVSFLWKRPSPAQGSTYIFKYLAMPNLKYLELDGDAWKVSDFGQSLSFAKLDTLRISNRSEHSFQADTINFLHSFSTARHLQLVHTSTQGLLFKSGRGLTRNNSINFRSPSPRTAPTNLDITTAIRPRLISTTVWPELRIITLDTLTADDVLNLCDCVASHKQLQVVELSTSARRHLSSSLRRKDDRVYQRPSLFVAAGNEEGSDDVEEWLGKMVEIRTFRPPSVGLLDSD